MITQYIDFEDKSASELFGCCSEQCISILKRNLILLLSSGFK